jgi:hypothetical protein
LDWKGARNSTGEVEVRGPVYVGFRGAWPVEILTGKTFSFSGNEDAPMVQIGDEVYEQHQHAQRSAER